MEQKITTIGLDLAKSVFREHAMAGDGTIIANVRRGARYACGVGRSPI